MSHPRTKVIVVGCGTAGPVLATFLKRKGYEPVVYERGKPGSDGGLSLMLQVNGLRVLSLIPGLFESISGKPVEKLEFYSTVPGDEGKLAESDIPRSYLLKNYGYTMMGVQRQKLLRLLTETAEKDGVEIKWEHKLVDLEQGPDSVTVKFENGHTDTAGFVIGCDGLHSNTRTCLFGKEEAAFTGMTQTGGFSPTPAAFSGTPTAYNFYSEDAHIIAYPIADSTYSWAITRREAEARETWRVADEKLQEGIKNGPMSTWGFGAGDLVKSGQNITKFGLYDRPALASWYKGRVVLIGDAAHPTSPHLGQGANQAFEDIYHLIRLLGVHNPDGKAPSTEVLSKIFAEFDSIRIPRTSSLVEGARKMGESRVVNGIEEGKARNAATREFWKDETMAIPSYELMLNGPFTGQSEI